MSLSDKIRITVSQYDIKSVDVKQFIKDLKFEMDLTMENANRINKLAGEKLI